MMDSDLMDRLRDLTRVDDDPVRVLRADLAEALDAVDAAERERDAVTALLRELLARVHRDGGQHSDAVGLAQATRDADGVIVRERTELDALRAEVGRWRDTDGGNA